MQERLALARAAEQVTLLAGALKLTNVATHRLPAPDLARVVSHAAAPEISAVPLKPAPRILGMDPALGPPHRQRLARGDAEEVEGGIAPLRRELHTLEPARRELVAAVGEILSPENTQLEHVSGRQLRSEVGIEIATLRLHERIHIALLHVVVHNDGGKAHRRGCAG